MKQILIATHGKMASGIRYTAELIVGRSEEITTIDAYVNPEDDIEAQFKEYFADHEKDRIFVFTDLMGGSVNQKLMKYAESENVTLITGTNLAVLMQVMMSDEDVTDAEIKEFIDEARQELQWVRLETEKKTVIAEGKIPAPDAASGTASEAETGAGQGTVLSAKKGAESETASAASAGAGQKEGREQFQNSGAKIAALRIDDRLIHGQVAMTWTKHLKVNGIIVANDDAANDNTQKMALKMAVPSGIKVLIKPVDEVIRVLNYPKASQMWILILTRTVKDALRIRRQVGKIEFLNLGNTGRFDGIDISEKTVLTSTIMLTAEEIECLRELAELDPGVCMQQVPNDEKKFVKDILGKLETEC